MNININTVNSIWNNIFVRKTRCKYYRNTDECGSKTSKFFKDAKNSISL